MMKCKDGKGIGRAGSGQSSGRDGPHGLQERMTFVGSVLL